MSRNLLRPSWLTPATMIIAGLLSCSDGGRNPADPSREGVTSIGSRPASVQGQSFSGTLSVSGQYDNTGQVSLPTYTSTTLVKITVSGLTQQIWNSPPSGMSPQPQSGDLNAAYNVRGAPFSGGCPYGLKLEYGGGWYDMLPPPGCNSAPASSNDTTVIWYMTLSSGTNRMIRSGAPTYTNPETGLPMYRYSGTLNVAVDWIQADAKLSANKRAITANTQVTFTASVSPTSAGGVSVPFSVVKWRWQPDNGPAVNPVTTCSGVTCLYSPAKSGTMFVDVMVNGVTDTKSIHITVFPCLIGDSLMDNPEIRRGIRESWDSSHTNAPDTQRLETGGMYSCTNGICSSTTFPHNASLGQDACTYHWDPSLAGGGIVYWHTHPFMPMDPNDPLPLAPFCPRNNPRTLPPGHVRVASRGPSDSDYVAASGFPHIVVDKENAYLIPGYPNNTPANLFTKPRSGPNGCDILAAPII